MSQKSITALLKAQILDSGLPVQERKKAVRRLPKPSRHFLESLIRDQSFPQDLRRAASRLLVAKIATPRTSKPTSTSPSPTSKLPNVETAIAESNPSVIDPYLWDLVGGVPGCVRGETSSLKAAKEPAQLRKPRTAVLPPEGHHD